MSAYIFEHHIQLAFLPVSAEVVRSEAKRIDKYLTLPANCDYHGLVIEHQKLSKAEQFIVDEGELLPALAFYWLNLGALIFQDSMSSGNVAALLVPSEQLVLPLSVGDLCAQIDSNSWHSPAAVFVVWGADATAFKRKPFPVRCDGALFPIIDGCGIGFIANRTDIQRFGLFSRA